MNLKGHHFELTNGLVKSNADMAAATPSTRKVVPKKYNITNLFFPSDVGYPASLYAPAGFTPRCPWPSQKYMNARE